MSKYRLQNGRLQHPLGVTQLEDRVTPTLCCGDFTTFTQGAYGNDKNESTPIQWLLANFDGAFPNGVQIGSQTAGAASDSNTSAGNQAALFTTAAAIRLWLPHGGPSGPLGGDTVNPNDPGDPDDGTLAGQTAALTLNVGIDQYNASFSPSNTHLKDLIVTSGPFAGKTVQFVLNTCNALLAGVSESTVGYTADQANVAATAINENFDNGSSNGGTDNGFLDCDDDDCDGNILVDVTILGRKFNDLNGNGNDDGGTDPGIANWHVTIGLDSNGDGSIDASETFDVTTVADGTFEFTGQVPTSVLAGAGAMYTVDEVQQSGWTQTYGNAGYDGTLTTTNPTAGGNDFGNFKNVTISGVKFYDANTDGDQDAGEPNVSGWKVTISVNGTDYVVFTTGTGYSFGDLDNADMDGNPLTGSDLKPGDVITVTEGSQTGWVPTTETSASFTVGVGGLQSGEVGTSNFGNVKLGAGGGLTLGFWSNKNGEKAMSSLTHGGMSAMLTGLSGLNLKDAAGNDFNPTTYTQFRTWLLNGTATNMSYMLSVQMAAMWLNTNADINSGTAGVQTAVNSTALIYAPGALGVNSAGFITASALVAEANAELGTHGLVLADSPFRSYQEALKNALDRANNNLNFALGLGSHWDSNNNGVLDSGELGTWDTW